jgi:hypothetical protein
MDRLATYLLTAVLFSVAAQMPAVAQASQTASDQAVSALAVPAGAKIELAVMEPVWANSARVGDALYTQTNFPVTVGGRVAIPPGTFVQGTIESIDEPTRRKSRAVVEVLFTKIIFANGYTILLPGSAPRSTGEDAPQAAPARLQTSDAGAATAVRLTIQVSRANDLLLDNGAQFEMTLAAPLALNPDQVTEAIALGRAQQPGSFKSATLCRPTAGTPGSPGTPDTVLPGTPGTPSTSIPGGPGMPDIIIPGTPPTPPTIIPGTPWIPGTPGTVCPAAPVVISSEPVALNATQGTITLAAPPNGHAN